MTPRSSIVFFFIFFFFQSEAQYSTHSLINVAFRAVLSPAICNEWCIALYVPRCTLPYFFFFLEFMQLSMNSCTSYENLFLSDLRLFLQNLDSLVIQSYTQKWINHLICIF